MTKTLETLVPDIYKLFDDGHECSEENLDAFAETVKATIKARLAAYKNPEQRTLRMSNVGKPDRQLWYDVNTDAGEPMPPQARIKFLYGDIIECMMILFAKEAGHLVEDEQKTIEVDGVVGHIDAKIDGVTVDVKSASDYAFKKFEDGSLKENDPFGYIKQINGYMEAQGTDGAFLAVNKVSGHLALLKVEPEGKELTERITHVRKMLTKETPPDRCYEEEDQGKSGNKKLPIGCSYCSHKFKCWSDSNNGAGLRTFTYSTGPIFFTEIKKEPNVFEVTNGY